MSALAWWAVICVKLAQLMLSDMALCDDIGQELTYDWQLEGGDIVGRFGLALIADRQSAKSICDSSP